MVFIHSNHEFEESSFCLMYRELRLTDSNTTQKKNRIRNLYEDPESDPKPTKTPGPAILRHSTYIGW